MEKRQLVLALGFVVGCALSSQAQIDVNLNGAEYATAAINSGYQFFYQPLQDDPFYMGLDRAVTFEPASQAVGGAPSAIEDISSIPQSIYPTLDDRSYAATESATAAVVPETVVPESSDYAWAGTSLLMVCGLATTLRNSYRKVLVA
jgi:hypothetical protein